MNNEKIYRIVNKENYSSKIDNIDLLTFEYVKILHEYLMHVTKSIEIKDKNHYRYIILRGYDLLKNVFLFLNFYTKNKELTCHHLRKSYLYYTEFIGQIGEDSNSYLQLNSKDACLFVYKKTIHEINEDFRKTYSLPVEEIEPHEELKSKILLINRVESLFIKKNLEKLLKKDFDIVKNLRVSIIKILEELNNLDDVKEKIIKINLFVDFIEFNFQKLNIDYINNLTIYFIKKINKYEISKDKIKKININFGDFLFEISAQRFVNKLFRN
jgi:hypothetical protein